MTVQTNTTIATGIGNGVTSVFPITFKFNRAEDLVVYLVDEETEAETPLTLYSDYIIDGAGTENGGTMTMLAGPLPIGQSVVAQRVVDLRQLTDLRNQGRFFAEVHEDVFDKLVMIDQQQQTQLDRSMVVDLLWRWNALGRRIINVGDPIADKDATHKRYVDQGDSASRQYADERDAHWVARSLRTPDPVSPLPGPESRAGRLLSFDANGRPVVVAPQPQSATELAMQLANPDKGAAMVARGVVAVVSIADLLALPAGQRSSNLHYIVRGYNAGTDYGGGDFYWDVSSTEPANDFLVFEVPGVTTGRFKRQRRERVGVTDAGAATDGTTPAQAAFQKVATLCDADQARYVYIPNFDENYRIESPVVLRYPGVKVFGDQGATYNRGKGKNGWLLAAPGLTHILDLGDSRSRADEPVEADHNPADHWMVEGVSFGRPEGSVPREADGVRFTTRSNGPDRGGRVRDCSFVSLKDAITVENPDVATVMGTLDIEGCVFVSCGSALNAKGLVFGLRFVGNQCEQNVGSFEGAPVGVIRGSLNGPVTITDNMLEGQPDVISIDIPPVTGNRPHLLSRGNYFEANTGYYVHRFSTNHPQSSLEIGPNFHQSITADDYLLIDNSTGNILATVKDEYPTTFSESSGMILPGSDIFPLSIRDYRLRKSRSGVGPTVVIDSYNKFFSETSDYFSVNYQDRAVSANFGVRSTPHGERVCALGNVFTTIPVPVEAGDLVVVNFLIRSEVLSGAGTASVQLWNSDTTAILKETGTIAIASRTNGSWVLISKAFIVNGDSSAVRFRVHPVSGATDTATLGLTFKNYGQFIDDGSNPVMIRPMCPRLPPITIAAEPAV